MLAATNKRVQGGWAVTLKSAAQRGLPVSLSDPRYLSKWLYVGQLQLRLGMQSDYDQAVRARGYD